MNHEEPLKYRARDLTTSYSKDGVLGNGSFGIVRLCRHATLKLVAVKCIKTDGSVENRPVFSKSFLKEVKIGFGKKHPNILEIYGIVEWKPNCIGIVSEFAEYKDLQSLFLKNKFQVKFGLRLRMMYEINNGAEYFHTLDKPVVHRDLKLQNILLSKGLQLKIADFGAARLVQTAGSSAVTSKLQCTPGYTAPEIIEDCHISPTPMQDMFSIAMVMFEIVTEKYAMEGVKKDLIDVSIKKGQRPRKIKTLKETLTREDENYPLICNLEEIIMSCWDNVPEKRMTATKVKEKLQVLIDDRRNYEAEVAAEVERLSGLLQHNITVNKEVALDKFSYPFEETEAPRTPETHNQISDDRTPVPGVINVPVVERNDVPLPPGGGVMFARTERAPDSLVLTGGQATMTSVVRYLPDKKRWKQLPNLNEGRCHHNSIIARDRLFVMGGINKANVLNSVECLDMKEMGRWTALPRMNRHRYQAAAEVLRDDIYVFGGKNEKDEGLDTIECLSMSTPFTNWKWTVVNIKLSERRFNFSTFLIPERDTVYCCGGMNFKERAMNVVEAINLKTGVCLKAELDQSRSGTCAVKANDNQFLLLGGLDKDGNQATNAVSGFKLGDETWKLSKEMKMKRCAFACGIIGTTVYAIGGHGENEKLSAMKTLEHMDLSDKEPEWQIATQPMDKNWAGHSAVVW